MSSARGQRLELARIACYRQRVTSRRIIGFVCVLWGATACGPEVRETRLGFYPAREPECSLEFVQADAHAYGPAGPWELVGYINISEKHSANPFSPKYRQIVRARACSQGGEAVTLLQAARRDSRFDSGSGVTYGVLRHRRPVPATTPF